MNEIQTHQESSLSFMNAFLATPKWGTFFYYAKSREELMDLFLLAILYGSERDFGKLLYEEFIPKMGNQN